jgi:hypothetical protein
MDDEYYTEKDLKIIKGFKLKYFQHLCKIKMDFKLPINELILREYSEIENGKTKTGKYFLSKCNGYQFIIYYKEYISWTKEYSIKKFFKEIMK